VHPRLDLVQATAKEVLALDPDPVVRWLLLRHILRREPGDAELGMAGELLPASRWVCQLEREQWEDGSWGRLHSMDYRAGQRIPTTEVGVERALALGLPADHRLLVRAAAYLAGVLQGTILPRDRPERNDRWPTGVRLFAAATLALIRPESPLLDEVWELWAEIARRAVRSGTYDPQAESAAHRELTGATVAGSYLALNNRYVLALLGARPGALPPDLERDLVRWVWGCPQGVGYLGEPLSAPPRRQTGGPLDRWLHSLALLLSFPSCRGVGAEAIDWLWAQRTAAGFWDFGSRPESPALPLSESWRKKDARQIDWTVRVLVLLRREIPPGTCSTGASVAYTRNDIRWMRREGSFSWFSSGREGNGGA
jgi:hypothetical protein